MNILSVHNRYQIRGGEDESCEAEKNLLKKYGHSITAYEENNDRINNIGIIRTALKTIWSRESYYKIKKICSKQKYDLMHVQNFFPLISPSVYFAAKSSGIPVVQSLRNYRLLCPNAIFFRHGYVCEDCLHKFIPLPGIINSCYRNSRFASLVVASMIIFHHIIRTWLNKVDIYIALTEFTRQKYIEGGFPSDKIFVKPNFVYPDPGAGQGKGNYAIFAGRLSAEKGIITLVEAWKKSGVSLKLKIIGEGPLHKELLQITSSTDKIELMGKRSILEVYEFIGNANFLIFPSEWYETFGRVAIEAFAKGTPVIASNIGAIAEVVEHGRTGLHFAPGNISDLIEKIEWFISHPLETKAMRKEAREVYKNKYTGEHNYKLLMEIYEKALVSSNKSW